MVKLPVILLIGWIKDLAITAKKNTLISCSITRGGLSLHYADAGTGIPVAADGNRCIQYNHTHISVKAEEDKPATCTEDGYIGATKCEDCGNILTDRIVVSALGHDWSEWTETTPATYEADGVETRVCKNDPSHIETRAIAKLVIDNPSGNENQADGGAQPEGENKTEGEKQIDGDNQSGGGSQPGSDTTQVNGKKTDSKSKKTTDIEKTTSEKKAAEQKNAEKITINKVPASVKVKVKKNKVTVSWKKIKKTKKTKKLLSQIKRIQVQYSMDPTFKGKTVTKKVGKNKTKITLKLKKKKTYYIRVRYVGKDGFSKWSKTKKVKTKK